MIKTKVRRQYFIYKIRTYMIKKLILHFYTITKHRWIVFKLSCRAGIPWRGLVHDLSKYSPTEFWEGVKYYQGNRSPIHACIKEKGYSEAKLHHIGRNKHHAAYWYDPLVRNSKPIIPYKYTVEMVCDKIAASKTYIPKDKWTKASPLEHWEQKEIRKILNPKIDSMLTEVFELIAQKGVNKVVKRSVFKKLYKKHVYETVKADEE